MFIRKWIFLLGALGAAAVAAAQDFPSRPIHLVVGFAPGGASDVIARQVASRLSARLGQTVVVDNMPGAGGTIAASAVAKATPDGYTLLFASASAMAISPWLNKDLHYDGVKSFAPVVELVHGYYILSGTPKLPITNMTQLIDYGKHNPGKLNCGSAGTGTIHHLACVLLAQSIGVPLAHVPYKGSAPAFVALMSGDIQIMFESVPTPVPLVQSGRVRGLAVTGPRRLDVLPDLPTFAEQGVKGVDVSFWFGMVAPAGTPKAVVDRINAAANDVLKEPEVLAALGKQGVQAQGGSPAEFGEVIQAAVRQWGDVVARAHIRLE